VCFPRGKLKATDWVFTFETHNDTPPCGCEVKKVKDQGHAARKCPSARIWYAYSVLHFVDIQQMAQLCAADHTPYFSLAFGAYTYAVVTTTIRLRFDGLRCTFVARSTAHQRSLSAHWRNTGRWPASRSHTDLFIYLGRSAAARSWRRSSNGRSAVELQSNCSRNHRLTEHCMDGSLCLLLPNSVLCI